ncbi:MAG: NAD(P)/FAD-dependent oxidoreductase [Clostridia bacterium]|nr:NAD(P)/FAD-dependent oxidoreductase [Clostridia bacterium]
MTDVVIIGGGPAGISAALTAAQRGKSVVIVASAPEDSLLWKAEKIDNYPGLPAVTGEELIEKVTAHAKSVGVEFIRGRALSILPMGDVLGVSVGSVFLDCGAVVLATGITRGRAFPGEKELLGAGVSYCATCDGMLYREKNVAVIGLSTDAVEEAEFLRGIGCKVEYFDEKRAKKYEIKGTERVEALVADGVTYPVEGVFVLRSGLAPDTLLPGLLTENGHIKVSADMSTSVPGVFAAGDCVNPPYQVAKAIGEGNISGISASKYVESKAKAAE